MLCSLIHHFTYIVHHIRPALHGYALEHREHGETKIVEVGDAVIRTVPVLITYHSFLARVAFTAW